MTASETKASGLTSVPWLALSIPPSRKWCLRPKAPTPYILVGGLFGRSATQIKNNEPGQNIFRLDPFANVDPTFNPGKGGG